jgi:hypothetical protein
MMTIDDMTSGRRAARVWSGLVLAGLVLAGCGTGGSPPPRVSQPLAPPPPPVAIAPAAAPAPLQADAEFASAETVWALRGGLNVAALLCSNRTLSAHYNQILRNHRTLLADAYATEQARYRKMHGTAWQARHDAAMTRLYNGFSNTPSRQRFCASAVRVAAELVAMPSAQMARTARRALATLDPAAPKLVLSTN